MKKIPPRKSLFIRAVIVFLVLTIGLFGLTSVNLARIQLINSEQYKQQAEKNQLRDTEISAERGIIYDANGTVLAKSASVWKVYIMPNEIDNEDFKNSLCKKLSEITQVSEESIKEKADKSQYAYLIIKRQIELEEKEKISELMKDCYKYSVHTENKKGEIVETEKKIYYRSAIGIDPDVKRYYPYGKLASNVIGFTGVDDVGRSGIELAYDSILTGTSGRIITAKNGKSDNMSDQYQTVYDAKQGTSLVLTIDEVIQRYLENSLEQAYINSNGAGAYGIVMDVETGAILAMANMENYDLNSPQSITDEENEELEKIENIEERNKTRNEILFKRWSNFIVSKTYEPGSVFKIITASAVLEENIVNTDFTYTCTGSIKIADRTIRCHKREGHGTEDFELALMNSCNPYFITVGQKLGKEKFYEYFEAFGFTEKTGIDLPEEVTPTAVKDGRGTYHAYENFGIVELASSSFGQSFQVSPIQMVTAISAIANGGYLMQPYVVAKELDENGNVVSETQPVVRRQVISKETASKVASMMEAVVSRGSGKNAYVAGYRVAGKTGTSQKLGNLGTYVASFGCFAPAENAKIAVLILVDEPKGQINGGQICAPVAAQVIENTLEYLGVERQYTEKELDKLDTNTPNLVGTSVSEARTRLESAGLSVKIVGSGEQVVSQMPAYNQTIPQNGIVVLYTQENSEKLTSTVPNLCHMNVSQANKYALAEGLNIKISGNLLNSGELVSYDQSIEAGAEVEYGTTITVYFKSNTGVNDFAD